MSNNNQDIIVESKKRTSLNPVITSIYTADPSAHVWSDGKIYIYASHDMDPARGCDLMDRYHVFSSQDMVNWVDEGEILVRTMSLGADLKAVSCGLQTVRTRMEPTISIILIRVTRIGMIRGKLG